MKKRVLSLLLLILLIYPNGFWAYRAKAASSLDVVINEVAWAGSLDDSSDEWIELKNNTDTEIDLTGWSISDDGTSTYTLSGTISANGYFLIESNDNAISTITANLVVSLSLANTGDTLVLFDSNGDTIDTINSLGATWVGGDNTTKATMERIDSELFGDSNFGTCTAGNGNSGSEGSSILGTPKSLNSLSSSETGTEVNLTVSSLTPARGDTVTVTASVSNVNELFSYGLDINYDATVLDYQSAEKGTFLSESDLITTAFNAELEDNTEGVLVIGEARTETEKTGISGDGTLFTVTFTLIDNTGEESEITISDSFLSDTVADIETDFNSVSITVAGDASQVENTQVNEGTDRYSLNITWTEPSGGATSYRILRMNQEGDFEELGTATGTSYNDASNIIPDVTYTYQIITILGSSESSPVEVDGNDSRGIKGDNNRSDRVDGRDLDSLAKHFGGTYSDEDYEELIDTTYDGNIDGSDLIDIGINWAATY